MELFFGVHFGTELYPGLASAEGAWKLCKAMPEINRWGVIVETRANPRPGPLVNASAKKARLAAQPARLVKGDQSALMASRRVRHSVSLFSLPVTLIADLVTSNGLRRVA